MTPKENEMHILKPSPLPMLSLAISTLVLCVFLVLFKAYSDLQKTLELIDQDMSNAHADAVVIAKQGAVINGTATEFNKDLERLVGACKGSVLLTPFITNFANGTGQVVTNYMSMVRDIAEKLAAGPGMVQDIHTAFDSSRASLAWGPLLPVALISILCIGMVVEAIAVEMCDSSTMAFEVDLSLRIATVLFAIVIVVVGAVGAGELFAANFLSVFCLDVDHNVLTGVEAKAGPSELLNISQHYIIGQGFNPLSDLLQTADKTIFDIVMEYHGVKSILDELGHIAMCPVTQFFHVREIAASAGKLIAAVDPLLANQHIYPFYESIVRKGMCGTVISSLGWILLSQLVIGLICFPFCVYFTHNFLTKWAVWEWAKEHAVDTGVDNQSVASLKTLSEEASDAENPETQWLCFSARAPSELSKEPSGVNSNASDSPRSGSGTARGEARSLRAVGTGQ